MFRVSCFLAALAWLLTACPREALSHTTPGASSLPSWCYHPPGDDCRWYRECLAARFPCEADDNSYALGFAEKICNRFTTRRGDFSTVGRTWIDNTRGCLQRQLVPLLSRDMSCQAIKAIAFRSHTLCYTHPPDGGPSFCELPYTDWLWVTWVVKETFLQETETVFTQVGQVLGGCASKGISSLFG